MSLKKKCSNLGEKKGRVKFTKTDFPDADKHDLIGGDIYSPPTVYQALCCVSIFEKVKPQVLSSRGPLPAGERRNVILVH